MRLLASKAKHENLNIRLAAAGVAARRRQLLGASLWFFILALSILSASRVLGETIPRIEGEDISTLTHWLAVVAGFIGTVRLFVKLIQNPLQNFLTAGIARVRVTPQRDDDEWLERIFESAGYRVTAFLLDYILSLKLPTSASLDEHRLAQAVKNFTAPPQS